MNRYDIVGSGMAARFTRTIQAAGFDIGNERDLQMGLIAYNSAKLVWQKHTEGRARGKIGRVPAAGRNGPCPCGSGVKYKKCCLRSGEARSDAVARRSSLRFGPGLIPHLSSEAGMLEDCLILSQVMDRDEELQKISFSHSRVASLFEKISQEQKLPKKMDRLEEELDRLAVRYATESGEGKIVEGLMDKFLDAASRARTAEDLRGLAAGVCLAMMAKASKDPNDNLLSIMIFRKTMRQAVLPNLITGKIVDQLGDDPAELRRRAEVRDAKLFKDIEERVSALTEFEKEEIQAYAERHNRQLFDAISTDRFPVPLPFATVLPS